MLDQEIQKITSFNNNLKLEIKEAQALAVCLQPASQPACLPACLSRFCQWFRCVCASPLVVSQGEVERLSGEKAATGKDLSQLNLHLKDQQAHKSKLDRQIDDL